jgi:uncharacterized protein (TIGR03503 family)
MRVAVHTIALSKNADHALMRALAETTDGWYEQVDDAEQLQKVFLRIFEKVGRPDTVPLQDNRFTIDNSVTEATVLVFHQPDAQTPRLISPGGESYDPRSAPPSIIWHQDTGYDMLTIKDPRAGEWQIQAESDPDNRVMVVTDLRMHATELPNRLIHGQVLPVEVSFTDHGRLILKPAFLNVLNLSAKLQVVGGVADTWPVLDNGQGGDAQAGDGLFSFEFGRDGLHPGVGELVIKAKGQTFVREKRMTFEVVPPLILEAKPAEQGNALLVSMQPDRQLVDESSLRTSIWMEDHQGKKFSLETTLDEDGVSHGSIDLMTFTGPRKIFVQASGKTKAGAELEYLDSPIELEGLLPRPEPVQAEPVAESVPVEQTTQNLQDEPSQPLDEATDWDSVALWFGLLNLVLLTAGGGVYWWLRKQSKKQLVKLVDEEESVDQDDEEAQAA